MNHIVATGTPASKAGTRCTAQKSDGRFCDAPSVPDAPFPICAKHAARIVMFARSRAEGLHEVDRIGSMLVAIRPDPAEVPARAPKHSDVVYYVRVGERIKIGTTTDLSSRIAAFGPCEFLACEPGSYSLEAQRHRQFAADLSAGREWFDPSPELLAHIEAVKAEHPQPKRRPARRPQSVDLKAARFKSTVSG